MVVHKANHKTYNIKMKYCNILIEKVKHTLGIVIIDDKHGTHFLMYWYNVYFTRKTI